MTTSSGEMPGPITTLLAPFSNLLDQRNLASYLAAAVFVIVSAFVVRRLRRGRWFRPRAMARLLFRKSVFLHPSSRLDYRLYLVNMPLMAFALGFFILNSGFWFDAASRGLVAAFGPGAVTTGTNWPLIIAITACQVLSMDLGYWLGHAAMHRSRILWEFHKVHHSAEVMTFATEYRQHPVELVVIPTTIGLTTGITFAVIQHAFGTGATNLGHMGYNIIIMAHIFTFHHLRHSHLDIAFTGFLGRLLHSPGHHMIHHSSDPAHHDTNMGYIFSIWDGLAGTLVIPTQGQRLRLGIGPEGAEHSSVARTFWLPFRNAHALIAARRTTPAPRSS